MTTLSPYSLEDVQQSMQAYTHYKDCILQTEDYIFIKGAKKIKKSGYRKLATAFHISVEIHREECKQYDGYFTWHITAKAIDAHGRFMMACGSCASNERDFSHVEHDVRSTAQTRASNRAISDLIGFGEVSAEEINDDNSPSISSITEGQKNYLSKLVMQKYASQPDTMKTLLHNINGLTKKQASDAINKLMPKKTEVE